MTQGARKHTALKNIELNSIIAYYVCYNISEPLND